MKTCKRAAFKGTVDELHGKVTIVVHASIQSRCIAEPCPHDGATTRSRSCSMLEDRIRCLFSLTYEI